jgi:hypothetical protein
MIVVESYAHAHRALAWVGETAGGAPVHAILVHANDTRALYGGVACGCLFHVEALQATDDEDARLLAELRASAPAGISLGMRLLDAPRSRARQVLDALAGAPGCDALVVPLRAGDGRLSANARLRRALAARCPVPLITLET